MEQLNQAAPDTTTGIRYLSPEQVAGMLGVPLKTVYTWQSEGTGPQFYKVGKRVVYIEVEVHRWVRSKAVLQR